jgi:hypothetical protein
VTEQPKQSYNPDWAAFNENRNWQAVTSPEKCQKIARKYGKKLIEVIDTGQTHAILRYICIFETEDSEQ